MRVCGLCHLAEAQIQPFLERTLSRPILSTHATPVLRWVKASEVERGIDLEQDVGDPHGRHPAVEIEYQLFRAVGGANGQARYPQIGKHRGDGTEPRLPIAERLLFLRSQMTVPF